jgi:UDP-glucuronate 4-epimerase
MRAVVTGAAGFIGSHLVESLCADGHEVTGIDALTDYYDPAIKRQRYERLAHPRFRAIVGDLLAENLHRLVDGADVVLHLAGQPGVRGSWGGGFDQHLDANVRATQRLLDACVAATVPRYVFASSSSVYGDAAEYPTREDALPAPVSPYGVTKLAAEHLGRVHAVRSGLAVASARFFTVYGPGQRPDMAIHRLIRAALTGEEFRLFGDGTARRDFTYVTDAVDALRRLVTADLEEPAATFNVGGGTECALSELIALVGEVSGRELRVVPSGVQPGDAERTGADTSRLRALGWQPRVDLPTGITAQLAQVRRSLQVGPPAERQY